VITLDNDFLSMFPHYAEKTVYISDGTLDISGSPELYINKLARNIAPIRMTGDYGSEVLKSSLFLGSNLPKEEMLHADFKGHIENARKTYKNVLHGHPLTFTLFKDAPWVGYGRLSVEQSQVTLRTPYMDNDLVKVMYRALQGWRTNREISIRLIKESNPALGTIPTDRGVGGCSNHLFQMISHAYSEFLFKGEYAFNYGMPQWLSRVDHSLEWMHLDRIFLGRHKFAHFRPWFRNELSDYIRDVLLDERTLSRPYLNRRFIQQMVQSHTKGYGNYTKQIIQVLTAELIHRVLIEKT
jgi:asparagine synthase (glutamine-hydrolysing)